MIQEKKGDLMKAKENVIAHQVNCKGVMGAGIAKLIRHQFLTASQYKQYQEICKSFGEELLGKCYLMRIAGNKRYVANLWGENEPTGIRQDTDYGALKNALKELELTVSQNNLTVALPSYLGCGLAGGDWQVVYGMIQEVFCHSSVPVTIYYLEDSIKKLWDEFGEVPMDPVDERIDEGWHGFPKGTVRQDIWHWFEDMFDVSVGKELLLQ